MRNLCYIDFLPALVFQYNIDGYITIILYLDSIDIKKSNYVPMYANGSLVLGQDYDGIATTEDFGEGFDPLQSYSGKVTQVEIWNTILSLEEIQNLANCVVSTTKSQNRVLTWNADDWKPNGQATFENIPLKDLCQKNIILNQLIWPRAIDFETFSTYCNSLDAIPPVVFKNSQKDEVYEEAKSIFIAVNKTFPSSFLDKSRGEGIRCFVSKTDSDIDFWLGMKWNQTKEEWYSPFKPSGDFSKFELDIISAEKKCAYIYGNTFYNSPCGRIYPCGICKVPEDTLIYLKGLCEEAYDIFDLQYYVYGLKNNRPYFR